jgi:hypothetical protein
MQYGHCLVADTAIAISSLYFLGIAPLSRPMMLFSPSQALKSSGASLRISRINLISFHHDSVPLCRLLKIAALFLYLKRECNRIDSAARRTLLIHPCTLR